MKSDLTQQGGGVYKQWTGLLEWWNTGMVDWVIFVLAFVIYHTISTS